MISHSCARQIAVATNVADTEDSQQAIVKSAVRSSASQKGFSLIEGVTVCLIILIVTSIAVVALGPMRDSAQINTAVQLTINQLRMAHEEAMAKRLQYVVTLQQPGTILTQWTKAGIGLQTERSVPLPNGTQFLNVPGIPNGTRTPDGFGTAVFAIDFDQAKGGGSNVIYFQPDGTAIDAAGNPNNGVVYIAKPGQLPSSRAITLFGATGRLKSWSLTGQGANLKWQ